LQNFKLIKFVTHFVNVCAGATIEDRFGLQNLHVKLYSKSKNILHVKKVALWLCVLAKF